MIVIWIEGTFESADISERSSGDAHVREGICHVHRFDVEVTTKKGNEWRRVLNVIHAFIKGNMSGNFDLFGVKVIIVCMAH